MMQEVASFVDQLKRGYEGDAWHGPALKELLTDVSAAEATARPIPGAHSVWEIVLHIAAWSNLFGRRLEGHPMDVPAEGDWPPVEETGEDAWAQALAKLDQAQQGLVRITSALPDSRLRETVVGKDYSIGFMLHGIIQHNVYHTGQIALLKKARPHSS
jgi:uncharacterized damage-inducible protein DinB